MCKFSFKELELIRIAAYVFEFNEASKKVLEKAGFHQEGILQNYYKRNDKIFDSYLYARIAKN